MRNKSILFTKSFFGILAIKIICSFLFGSAYITKGFIPFVMYFVNTGKNPYEHFAALHTIVFPYPAMMLVVFSLPMFIGKVLLGPLYHIVFMQLFLMRVPILIADIGIYVILCKLLPSKEKKVLWFYFASPILFYINYYHGQLDSIPTAFLLFSVFALFQKREFLSYLLLGIGIATKTHLLIVLPFYFFYLLKSHYSIQKILFFSVLAIIIFCIPNSFFYSKGFLYTVFNNPEQQRLFFLNIPFEYKGISLFIAPAAILGILYHFSSYKKVNTDSLLLSLGLVFTVLIALVPPMQGWFYWSFPFLVYFFIKYTKANSLSFWLMNLFYILFFLSTKDSDIWQSLSLLFPSLSKLPTPFYLLQTRGINPFVIQNIFFTGLEVSVLMNILWCYRVGIYYNSLYIKKEKPFICGIGGNSGVGKSTLTKIIADTLGEKNIVVLNGDDAHKWERGNEQWNVFTHLHPGGNRIHTDYEQMYALQNGESIERVEYDHTTGTFNKPIKVSSNRFIILQGLHPFVIENMRAMFDIKIYMETSEELHKKWKIERDTEERGHKKSHIEREIKRRSADFKKFIVPQKKFANWIIKYELVSKKKLQASYIFSTTLRIDAVVEALQKYEQLFLTHTYTDINSQKLTISGQIEASELEKICYSLYPNMEDIIGHKPVFHKNINGVHQLFFLTMVNNAYLQKRNSDETIY